MRSEGVGRNSEPQLNLEELLVSSPGRAPQTLAKNSHFNEPVNNEKFSGRSRRWGDASRDVQLKTIATLFAEAEKANFSCDSIALLLATARIESGFNPDAAAGSTSASGIGQFIDKTGRAYGLNEDNRFNIQSGAKALVQHLKNNISYVERRWPNKSSSEKTALAYAIHHDGPSLKYGGLELAWSKVVPLAKSLIKLVSSSNCSQKP